MAYNRDVKDHCLILVNILDITYKLSDRSTSWKIRYNSCTIIRANDTKTAILTN